MSGLLSVLGFVALLVALVGLCKGSLRSVGLATRTSCAKAAAAAFVVMMVGGAMAPAPPAPADPVAQEEPPRTAAPDTTPTATPSTTASSPSSTSAEPMEVIPSSPPPAEPAPLQATSPPPEPARPTPPPAPAAQPKRVRTAPAAAPLLVMAAGGDGDSWRDTRGVEYRMGLINTPETNECGGSTATTYRKRALAGGFRAQVYETDRYGRRVAVILAPNGVNLNVAMARDGIANDRFLAEYRHENPALAAQLDAAFREARAAGRGIWRTCRSSGDAAPGGAPAPAPKPLAGGRCHPDYEPCIPLRGDGSGRGAANDLDCGEIEQTVRLRQLGRDPYRLDGNDQDGVGCE